jgi:hypothetical protein
VELGKETVKDLWSGQTVAGENTAVKLSDLGIKALKGIILRTPGTADDAVGEVANVKPVWVGPKGVTPSTGYPLLPGKGLGVPLELCADLYIVSTVPDQIVAWIAF